MSSTAVTASNACVVNQIRVDVTSPLLPFLQSATKLLQPRSGRALGGVGTRYVRAIRTVGGPDPAGAEHVSKGQVMPQKVIHRYPPPNRSVLFNLLNSI